MEPGLPASGGGGGITTSLYIVRSYLWALLPTTCGIAVSILFFTMARDHATWEWWSRWVPFSLWPVFSDLTMTMQHLREAERGLDVLGDPTSRFAYPRAVLALRYFGFQHVPPAWLGLAQGMVFTLATVAVLQPFTPRRAAGVAMFLLTPAMFLGFERGNMDFLLFPLCAGAAWLWSRCEQSGKPKLAVLALVSAALLKLYPVFGLMAAAIAEKSRRRLYWIVGLSTVFVYFYAIRSELAFVRQKVPVATTSSWGSLVSFARIDAHLDRQPPASWLATIDWPLVALATYGVVFALGLFVGRRLAPRFAARAWPADEWCYYWVGAGICCGSFAAANFVYRWAFALLTLPLLLRAAHSRDTSLGLWARVAIAVMFVGFVAKLSLPAVPFTLVQLANWLFIFALIVGASGLYFSAARRQDATADREDPAGDDVPPLPASATQS